MKKLLLLLVLLVLLVAPVYAFPEEIVPRTLASPQIDGFLDFSLEWNGSYVVSWHNVLSEVEYDSAYLLHNDTHYLFAAILHDPDHKLDDSFTLYASFNDITYRYIIPEGSSVISLYNLTDGETSLQTNATGIMTRTSPGFYWIYIELAIPKEEWNLATNVSLLFVHEHTFKTYARSMYPEQADLNDTSTWLKVVYAHALEGYKVVLNFADRDGSPIGYVSGRSYAVIRFSNGTEYLTIAPSNSTIEVVLPSENYTITFYVYQIPVFKENFTVENNITLNYVLDNLKHVETPLGDVVGLVEYPAQIASIWLEPSKQLGMLIANGTKPAALRLYPTISWNFSFVTVLNAENFTYDPFAPSLLAYTTGNLSGITMIGAPAGYPVFYYANGSVKGYAYDVRSEELHAWVSSGSFKIFHQKPPFAVILNGTALKRGTDYSVNVLNVTSLSILGGDLRVFYSNPVTFQIHAGESKVTVEIATPYNFKGSYKLKITKDGETIEEKSGVFTATSPLSILEISLGSLQAGEYSVEVSLTDEDSQQLLGTQTEPLTIRLIELPYDYVFAFIFIIILMMAVAAIFMATRKAVKSRHTAVFVKRKT